MSWEKIESDKLEADYKKDKAVLDFALSFVSERDRGGIDTEIREGGWCMNFLIVDKPVGVEQDEEFDHGKRYVNQTKNGGYSGDDFAGTISIPIGCGKWLQFNYIM
jgi:hypothetical protein